MDSGSCIYSMRAYDAVWTRAVEGTHMNAALPVPVTTYDVLYIGLKKESYITAIDAVEAWGKIHITNPHESFAYFDTSFLQAASFAASLPNLSVIYIGNEVGMRRDIAHAACRSLIERLRDRQEKPVVVLTGDMLDTVDDFSAAGFIVELKPKSGTIEEMLRTFVL